MRRYLEIFDSTGDVPSELFRRKAAAGASWRFDRSCLLWLDVERDVLGLSLDARVQQMLEHGLLREVEPLLRQPGGFSRGLAQAIGVREFAPLFRRGGGAAENSGADGGGEGAVDDDSASGDTASGEAAGGSGGGGGAGHPPGFIPAGAEDDAAERSAVLPACVAQLQTSTRRLAAQQARRLATLQQEHGWPWRRLDATAALSAATAAEVDVAWDAAVLQPALAAVRAAQVGGTSRHHTR